MWLLANSISIWSTTSWNLKHSISVSAPYFGLNSGQTPDFNLNSCWTLKIDLNTCQTPNFDLNSCKTPNFDPKSVKHSPFFLAYWRNWNYLTYQFFSIKFI